MVRNNSKQAKKFNFACFFMRFFEIMRIKVVNEYCESCNCNVIKNVGGH